MQTILSLRIRRVLAFIIDYLICMGLGRVVGMIFWPHIITIGHNAYLIGYAICVLYHGIFNAIVLDGQSIGKILFRIKVVSQYDRIISIPASLLRSAIVFWGFFFSYIVIPQNLEGGVSIILAIVNVGTIYLLFATPRRCMHDYLLGTMVVEDDENVEFTEPLPRKHLYGIGIVVTSFLLISSVVDRLMIAHILASYHPGDGSAKRIERIRTQMMAMPNVKELGLEMKNERYSFMIQTTESPYDCRTLMVKGACIVAAEGGMDDTVPLQVIIMQGYDMGICHSWETYDDTHLPSEWFKELAKLYKH